MINKSNINIHELQSYDYQAVLAFIKIEESDKYPNSTKYLLAHTFFENNNLQTRIQVAIKKADKTNEILFENYSISKAIEFYNNLK